MEHSKIIWKRPGFLIRRLHQISVAIFINECNDLALDITAVQWGVLSIVSESPGVGQVEISEELGLDRSNVANVVDRLTRRGLLRQKVSETDQRKKEITITKAGQRTMAELEGCAARFQRKLLSPLTDGEHELFIKLLTRLVQQNNHLGRATLRIS